MRAVISALACLTVLACLASVPAQAACPWTDPDKVLAACQKQCVENLEPGEQVLQCKKQCQEANQRYQFWTAQPCNADNQGSCSADIEKRGQGRGLIGDIAWSLVAKKGCLAETEP